MLVAISLKSKVRQGRSKNEGGRAGEERKEESTKSKATFCHCTRYSQPSLLSKESMVGIAEEPSDANEGPGISQEGGDGSKELEDTSKQSADNSQKDIEEGMPPPAQASLLFDISQLDPPMTRRETFRNCLLRFLDRPEFQVFGMVVLFLMVADGALFFFFLMGWQTLCDTPSKTDCEPRNTVYNISVQILTGIFTYMVTVSMPWRCANFVHTFGLGIRDNSTGLDLFGRPTNEIWFHIGWWNRAGIIICLLLNCLLQYANQTTRIIFHTYDLQVSNS